MADKPVTVTVEALEPHTAFGESYDVGDRYDIDVQFVDSVEAQGKASRVDSAKPRAAKAKSKPVKPMTLKAKPATYTRKDLRAKK